MDPRAAEGFAGAEQYDAYRPGYPAETTIRSSAGRRGWAGAPPSWTSPPARVS